MKSDKYIDKNTSGLCGKTVAITGSTGGLGKEICRHLASLGADLILLDRNGKRSAEHRDSLLKLNPDIKVSLISLDLEDMESVRAATEALLSMGLDVFIHNAGAYSIPRHKCSTGFDNVFQINFVSPYYMIRRLLPMLSERRGRVVAVGSIAHNYSKIDERDVDFSTRTAASLVYGNAKRFLMLSLFELFKNESGATLAISHPGITFTNITNHYPPIIFAIIKHPMKIIFMKPKRAALSVVKGVFEECGYLEWWGPRYLDVWGLPKKKRLRSADSHEIAKISEITEKIYKNLEESE